MEYAIFFGELMRKRLLILIFSLILTAKAFAAETGETCVTATCHPAMKEFKVIHQPVKVGNCLACHKQTNKEHPLKGGKSFELTAKIPAMCYKCHNAMGKKKVVHQPVKEGDCSSCHKVHGAANKFLLEVGSDQSDLCFGCHDAAMMKMKFAHGPAAAGECTTCHTPHEGDEKRLMRAKTRDVCLKCHDEFGKNMKAAKVLHAPVQIDSCTACHKPHAADFKYFLKKDVADLCVGCHAKIAKKHNDAPVKHKPLVQPLGCSGCHSTHFSQYKGLLAMNEKDMCLTCHGVDTLGNPPLKNMSKELANKKYLHGPIQKERCTPCHDPHGSATFRLLKGNYPDQLYAPFKDNSFSFCLNCHEKNLLKYPETTLYTKFRNGKENLHFVHVANKRKGRSCKLCHDIHASNGQKLISPEGSPFGDWKVPTRFKMTDTGGSCAPGCHKPYSYDRVTPVNYAPTPAQTDEKKN